MATLAELLKTEDAEQQVAVVEKLLKLAQSPVVTMTVVLDTRSGKTDILLNGQYSYDEIYALLDLTRREVQRREREAVVSQKVE